MLDNHAVIDAKDIDHGLTKILGAVGRVDMQIDQIAIRRAAHNPRPQTRGSAGRIR